MVRAKADFLFVNHGTIYLVYPTTHRAKQWINENLTQVHMQYADAWVVEEVYIDNIIDRIHMDDLNIAYSRVPLPS